MLQRKAVYALVFVVYGLTWTLLPSAANTSLGRDTIQIIYWGQEWQAGYFKHPPLIAWLTEIVIFLFGRHDVAIYALSASIMLASFAAIHHLARRYVCPDAALISVVALPAFGFYSFIVPHFDHNIILMLPWCLTILFGYLAVEERRAWAWPLLGLSIGIGILSKYTILILPFLFLIHVVWTPRHRALLLMPRAWLAVGLCFLVAAPHIYWVVANDLAPLRYFRDGAGLADAASSFFSRHILNPLDALSGMVGMSVSAMIVMLGALGLPKLRRRAMSSQDGFLLLATFGPVGLVLLLSAVTGGEMRLEWATTFFLTLPLVLMRWVYSAPGHMQVGRFLAWSSGLAVAMATTYLLIFIGVTPVVEESKWARFPAKLLAAKVTDAWAQVCDGPVPVLVGDSWLAGTAAYKSADRPRVYTEADPYMAPWLSDAKVRASGAVIVWDMDLSGRYRDIDHQDPPKAGEPMDWFPGIAAMEQRFGPITTLPEVVLGYHGPVFQDPVRLGLAVIPPEKGCHSKR
ncbi:glycosyltransferase [Paramagnetospirillum kuznetsovii]|uniref:Glycosyltransferase n=1 Tax=Paramagnetospirillum kuznetsovii TaxID=2053833 RepID=A0A364P0A1_9PROT|nr:glycosyltransferase [Paramagnetospirillum kuznetsovii]